MSIEIRVPTLGESIVDAVIASWLKHEGDSVSQGEALVELETDKVNVEVTADQGGVLQKIVKQEGDTVAVGEVLGVIGEGADTGGSAAAQASDTPKTAEEPPQPTQAASDGQKTPTGQLQPAQAASDGQRPPSPLARRVAAEYDVDISQVQGTSPHGRITRDDVVSYVEQQAQHTSPSQKITPPSDTPAEPKSEQAGTTNTTAATPTTPTTPTTLQDQRAMSRL